VNILSKLQSIDRRVIYILTAAVVVYALLNPMGLPIKVNKETQMAYDYMDGLPAGSEVVFGMDYSVSNIPEQGTAAIAMVRHAFQKNLKVIFVGMWVEAGNLAKIVMNDAGIQKDFGNKVYGTDWVNVGYKPGQQVWAQSTVNDFIGACKDVDFSGKQLSTMPIFQSFKKASDAELWICFAAGNPGIEELIKTVGAAGTPLAASVAGVSAAGNLPLLQAGQIQGLLMGMRGSAEYEQLNKAPGAASSGMDAQSLTHVLLVMFIILGNIGYFASRRENDGKQR
jgi:hypothetical protein